MIKTSVIIPVYNTAPYLEECINSVFKQTQQEIEVIAINDGSTDDSWEVLLEMKRKHPNLIIMNQENQGLGHTRNVGLENARGEYIHFLDSDDYIEEDTLEICYGHASKNDLDIVLFDALKFEDSDDRMPIYPNADDRHEIIAERDEVFSGIYFMETYYKKAYEPSACFAYYALGFLRENRVEFLPRVYFEDNEFHCRVMTLADRVMYIPRMFYQRRCRNTSITGMRFDLRRAADHIEVINKMAELKTLRGGKGWKFIKEIALGFIVYVARVCRDNNLYSADMGISQQILNAWIKVCGHDIEFIEDLDEIDYIGRVCSFFPKADLCMGKERVNARWKQLMINVFDLLGLQDAQKRIAIYGCGRYTEKVLDLYESLMGDIGATVTFLDSYAGGGGTHYRNLPVYNVRELGRLEPDCILVSSPLYEKDMKNMIRELYGDRFPVISLSGDLRINP